MGLIGWADAVNDFDNEASAAVTQAPSPEHALSMFGEADLTPEEMLELDEDEIEALDQQQRVVDNAVYSAIESEYAQAVAAAEEFDRHQAIEYWEHAQTGSVFDEEVEPARECTLQECSPAPECRQKAEDTLLEQLVECIRNLKLRDVDGSGQCCDITRLELHEVEFMLKHAERSTNVDYYRIAREVHGVKRRILDLVDTPDLTSSNNLDALMNLVEDKYEASFNGDME